MSTCAATSNLLTVLLLGATGETGKEVLKHLLSNSDVGKIILVGRRKVEFPQQPDCDKVTTDISSCGRYT